MDLPRSSKLGSTRPGTAISSSSGATEGPPSAAERSSHPDRPDVFISYSRRDKQFVESRLFAAFGALGKEVWIDLEDIPPAADWRERVWDGIEAAKAFVFVMTPASVSSDICREEVTRAIEAKKRLIPVLRHEVESKAVPHELERPNWILLRDQDDFDAQFSRLIEALETDLDWVDMHARLAVRAREWGRAGKDTSLLLRGSDLLAAERWLAEQASHKEGATPDQTEYIVAGRNAAARRRRLTLGAVVAALLLSLGLAVVALLQRNQAVANEKTARSRELAATAQFTLGSNPELGVALASEANAVSPTSQALGALRESLQRWPGLGAFQHPGGRLRGAAYSPDGRLVLTANGRSMRIWDASSRRMLTELDDDGESPPRARFTSDSRAVLSTHGRTLTVSTARTGRPVRVLRFAHGVKSARFSRSGQQLLVVTEMAASVWTWPRAQPIAVLRAPAWRLENADLSSDGRYVLGWGAHYAGKQAYRAFLWRVRDRRRIATIAKREPISDATFSRQGDVFVVGSADDSAELWRVQPPLHLRTVRHHYDVTAASFSPDGRSVLTSGLDGKARVWETTGRGQVAVLERPTAGGSFFTASAFSPDSRRVVMTDDAGGAGVWDVSRPRPILTVHAHATNAVSAIFSPDGASVLTAGEDGEVREWRARPGARSFPLREREEHVETFEFAPDGRTAVTASDDGFARVWDTRSGRTILRRGHGDSLAGAAFTDAGRLVVAAGKDGKVDVWRMDNGRRLGGFTERRRLTNVWGSRSSRLVLLTSPDGGATILDARSLRRIAGLGVRGEPIDLAEFTADGRYLMTSGVKQPTRVWRIPSGRPVAVLGGERRVSYGATLSPDGRFVVTAENDGLHAYATANGHPARGLPGRSVGQSSPVFSRDGRTLAATNSFEGRVQVFDWASKSLLTEVPGQIEHIALDDSGDYLATAAGGTVQVWDARTGQRVGTFTARPAVSALVLSGDAKALLAAQRNGLVRLIPCDVCRSRDALLALARSRGAHSLSAAERRRYLRN